MDHVMTPALTIDQVDIRLALADLVGEQKLTGIKIDHLSELVARDIGGLRADAVALRDEVAEVKKNKVSLDRFQWVERAAYGALAAVVAAWVKFVTGF